LRLEVVGQRNLLQAIHGLLAIGEIIAGEVEVHLYVAQAENADGTDLIEFRCAVEACLHRNGDLLLHFFGGPGRILGDEFNHRRRWVRISLDIKLQKCVRTDREHREKHDEDDIAVAKENPNQRLHGY
jgi:hypothetical protein